MQFLHRYWFSLSIFSIFLLATVLRFYNFENRWGLAYDQARDVIVATEAVMSHKIPLIGPFTSAGQFVYGPQWIWILVILIQIYPSNVLTPWIVQAVLYVAVVGLMILIGKELENKTFGLLLGILTAVSTAQIIQSTNLTSPSMVGIITFVTFYIFIMFIKNGKTLFAFLLTFCIGNAINIHFQAIGLLSLIPIALLFGKRSSKTVLGMLIGIFIPFIPLIIFDLRTNFFESKGILDYYFHGQYQIYVPNRWLTYAFVFWPTSWSKIIGGHIALSYLTIALLCVITFYEIVKRKLSKVTLAIIISFLTAFTMLRYYRGERFESYLVFLHPFVIFLTSFVIYRAFFYNRFIAVFLLLAILYGSIGLDLVEMRNATNLLSQRASGWKKLLIKSYPNHKFSIYDYKFRSHGYSLPLVLFLQKDGKISDSGYKIGFGNSENKYDLFHPDIKGNIFGFSLEDLNSSSSGELAKEGWAPVNPSATYYSTVEWYKK